MAIIDLAVLMVGSSDAKAMPIRQINVSAILRGVGGGGPGGAHPSPASSPTQPEKVQ